MTNEDVKKITKAFDGKFKLLLGEVARIKTEISDSKTTQFRNYTELSRIGKDISRIDGTLETLSEDGGKHTKKLNILWEQTDKITLELENIKDKIDNQNTFLKANSERNNANIKRLDKRVGEAEKHLGIAPPPESHII